MNKLSEKVREFLLRKNLIPTDKKFLVAFSGGYDSMCLLHILSKICSSNLVAIHLNHNWRGDDSIKDELNCKKFCEQLGIEFYTETLSENIEKTETAARDARYEFFYKCAKKYSSNVVFTAHNANDNAETIIYRIAKGTAIDGLCGIQEVRDIFYRPLLNTKRKEIENYCTSFKLVPNIDKSNFDTKYKRNFVRHEIIPLLEKINKDAIDAINNLSAAAMQDCSFISKFAQNLDNNTKNFINKDKAIQMRVIKSLLTTNNLDYDKEKLTLLTDFIIENSNSKSGKTCSISNELSLYVNNKYFSVINTKKALEIKPITITKEGIYKTEFGSLKIEKCLKIPSRFPSDNENIAYVCLDKIDFTLRQREDGDIITPLGSSGTQKLKKYLNEKKIPQHKKDSLLFLCQNNEILWAIGLGISDKIKVDKKVTHKLSFKEREKNYEQC